MPELPEVETVKNGLIPVLKNQIISDIKLYRSDLRIPFTKGIEQHLKNKKIIGLERRAKYIICDIEGPRYLVIHLGMTGSFESYPRNEKYNHQLHDHFVLTLKNGTKLAYNDPRRFGMVFSLEKKEWERSQYFHHLGLEPLSSEFTAEYLHSKLSGKIVSIKQAIMDQRVVVGVGNIYASEALYLSKINPKIKAGKISLKRLKNLVENIRLVLKKSIEAGGSTLKDYKKVDGGMGYFQHQFYVYDKEGEICILCKKAGEMSPCIKRIVQSGRSTFYCTRLQK
ncbi:MAG: bifunctional DNA-formamidopyrimidine glycosylase/DNA-(apurinic or apyrimidinic site) lyase [Pseudomonadota bacterium]